MNCLGGSWRRLVLLAVGLCVFVGRASNAQTPQQSPPDPPRSKEAPREKKDDDKPVQEIGGRLVVSGDSVLVVANPDDPPRDASIATKTDTPLLETPRSVSVTDRRTLDDRLATNVRDAHEYTVGVTPMDDRGPVFARGFVIGFYDLRRDGLRTFSWSVREPVGLEGLCLT
jgi:iron complex outermembrane recepter protein